MSEHEQKHEEEEGQEREELKDLDVPEEESKDVKGGKKDAIDSRNIN